MEDVSLSATLLSLESSDCVQLQCFKLYGLQFAAKYMASWQSSDVLLLRDYTSDLHTVVCCIAA